MLLIVSNQVSQFDPIIF
jgi:hypothetical protein